MSAMDSLKIDAATGKISINIDLRALINAAGNNAILTQLATLMGENGPAAANAERMLNSRLSLTIEPDNTIAVATKSYDTFTRFPKLPMELRLRVWREAMPGPRVVEVHIHEEVEELYRYSTSSTPRPILLYINRESRKEALRFYGEIFSNHRVTNIARGWMKHLAAPIYLDPDQDTVYFSGCSSNGVKMRDIYAEAYLHAVIGSPLRATSLCHINKIAFPFSPKANGFALGGIMFNFPILKSVSFVLNEDCEPLDILNRPSSNEPRSLSLSNLSQLEATKWNTEMNVLVPEIMKQVKRVREIWCEYTGIYKRHKARYFVGEPQFLLQKEIRQ